MKNEILKKFLPTLIGASLVWIPFFLWFVNYEQNEQTKKHNSEVKECTDTTIVVIDAVNYQLAVNHIKYYEVDTFRTHAYDLDGDVYIGYGHLVQSGYSKPITESQGDSILQADLMRCIQYVNKKYDVWGDQALALALLYYNVSWKSIHGSQLHQQLLGEKNEEKMKPSWLSLCRFRGKEHRLLKERRIFETNLFFN
jgi:hypothetical protein